ncbi:MAG: threonylcarbamoyl-AMP synthase [Desulfobacterales bacterium]|nr:threonylcarbamoyl-AMP synthase [Desulfobacterales bacterium]MCP4160158.1 threonylcarbamoyl-AMP synthase [Deltaproteobacteria bacterium]
MILKINEENPQERLVDKVTDILKKGGVIVYPTDTCYGIGCDIMNKKAIEKVYKLKGQDKKKPFSFICSDLKNISHYADVSNYAYRVMKKLLPGTYTFILDASREVPKMMLTKRKTAGIRIPNNNICIKIVESLGNPIISTTASDNTGEIFNDPSLIDDFFGNRLDAVIDGGISHGEQSSIVSLIGDEPEIIREGIGDVSVF